MPVAHLPIGVVRRTLDILLVVLIGFVVGILCLARVLPLLTGGTTFVVAGASMEPAIPMGSLVHVAPVAERALAPGDVVSIRVGDEHAVFTHRIVRVATLPDGLYIETRGDANPSVDPSLVPSSAVVGRVALAVPFLGFGVALLGSAQGVALLLALAAMLLAGIWLLESAEDDQREAVRRHASEGIARSPGEAVGDAGLQP